LPSLVLKTPAALLLADAIVWFVVAMGVGLGILKG